MINPMLSDADVETWFARNAGGATIVADHILLPLAPWIPIIGIPANDR